MEITVAAEVEEVEAIITEIGIQIIEVAVVIEILIIEIRIPNQDLIPNLDRFI